jgi:hypothetical protein
MNLLNSTFFKLSMATLVVGGFTLFGALTASADPGAKVSICHATGSAANPFVVITVSVSSGDLTGALAKSGHFDPNGNPESGHEEDFFVEGKISKDECVRPTPTPTPTPSPTPSPSPAPTPSPTPA